MGQAHLLSLFLGSVEERAPVRTVVSDSIVAIDVQRARIATIVSIAQQYDTTKAVSEGSTYILPNASAKLIHLFVFSKSKSDYFFCPPLLSRSGRRLCALCSLFSLRAYIPSSQMGSVVNASAHSQRNAPQLAP